jgi:hypothetical protein
MSFPVSVALALYALPALAHPAPDVPVRARFAHDGQAVIQVEVDPRCFEDDPLHAPYLTRRELDAMGPAQRRQLEVRAAAFIAATIHFFFEPTAPTPEFHYTFTTHGGKPLGSEPETPVVVMAESRLVIPEETSAYWIEALPNGRHSVLFQNLKDGVEQRRNVLFPGETSYRLRLDPS